MDTRSDGQAELGAGAVQKPPVVSTKTTPTQNVPHIVTAQTNMTEDNKSFMRCRRYAFNGHNRYTQYMYIYMTRHSIWTTVFHRHRSLDWNKVNRENQWCEHTSMG